jgi:hypothetical protein
MALEISMPPGVSMGSSYNTLTKSIHGDGGFR